eukprot:CAMPEP_0206298914 /NCGR_PEP_ID=MMETSP0106_2-20121207/6927_1 /ASSEMBLY_ACC=CAM_ASM_000206 /TAXON_ID=81532 /ORGANISM="Acanthoeca-like sp., Strain 10tr" /LENGTH=907 /DNA_ID=CAMNT_0053729613 /DNA_START=27 /DNA_END=2750 /DNA_ORIENTATION=+
MGRRSSGVAIYERGSIQAASEQLLDEDEDDEFILLDRRESTIGRRRSRYTEFRDGGKKYQSLEYEDDESEVWRYFEAERWRRDRGKWFGVRRRRSFKRWILVALTGAIIASLGVLATWFTNHITNWKFGVAQSLLEKHDVAVAYVFYVLVNIALVSVAAACVAIEPAAAGSGIPEVKCFLNGINLPRVMRIKTLASKLFGVIFSVAGGLPCGKEGPMIHSGACVGAGITQGKSDQIGYDLSFSMFQDFRNDREKRDFVACGAAGGVCTAFHAPIGGVLFALEEGATHWSADLTWRTFFCTMVTLFVLYVGNTAILATGFDSHGNMFSFGKFSSLSGEGTLNYSVWELVNFGAIGMIGGVIGAIFNILNKKLTLQRKKIFGFSGTVSAKNRSAKKYLEVLVVSAIMSTISFCLPLAYGDCRAVPTDYNHSTQDRQLMDNLVRFRCAQGEWNEMATLSFTGSDTAIRHLFHMREEGRGENEETTFSPNILGVFFVCYFTMAIVTYGLAVPSGLFVPSLLSGAAMGRMIASLLHTADNFHGDFADAGTYALVGAVAVLGGVARMTISLTVIMLEATGDMQYVLPLMITLMMSRWSGNIFCEGLYDMHIHLNKLPILESDPPESSRTHDLCAREIMSQEVVSVEPVITVGALYDTVTSNTHGCFPVMRTSGVLQGLILRKRVAMIFAHKAFGLGLDNGNAAPAEGTVDAAAGAAERNDLTERTLSQSFGPAVTTVESEDPTELLSPLVTWEMLEKPYPRYPDVSDNPPTDDERDMIVDLRPYINTSPYTVHESTSVMRAYKFFRLNALRQLCVVDSDNRCIGVLTRYDLLQSKVDRVASTATDWSINPTDLPEMQYNTRLSNVADEYHAPRRRRIMPVMDGDDIVGYTYQGDGRASRREEAPRHTALGEMV